MAKGPIDKMQFKGGDALVLRAPEEFEAELSSLRERTPVKTTLRSKGPFPFALAFVTSCAEIEALAAKVADRVEEDGILWFAYPKKSSKRYDSDVGRDDSWGPLGEVGFELEWSTWPMGHAVLPEEIEAIARFLVRVL